jgi:ATP-dependent DNA helicase RecG
LIKSGNYRSYPRNLQIASIFKEAGLIEKYGSGIKRVIQEFKDYGLPGPVFEETQGGISVTIFNNMINEEINEEISGGVSGGVNGLYEVIKSNPGKNTKAYASLLNVPPKTLEKWLIKLKKEDKIKFVGSSKTGGYFVKTNEK